MNDDSRSGPVTVDERDSVRPPSLRGSTVVEVMVSFTLLSAVLGVATPWVVRHGRLLNNHREYRTAIDELSNQLELVTSLDVDALPDAMGRLAPSKLALARLPGAAMSGELQQVDGGFHIRLQLSWDGPSRRATSVEMAAWIYPVTSPNATPQLFEERNE